MLPSRHLYLEVESPMLNQNTYSKGYDDVWYRNAHGLFFFFRKNLVTIILVCSTEIQSLGMGKKKSVLY